MVCVKRLVKFIIKLRFYKCLLLFLLYYILFFWLKDFFFKNENISDYNLVIEISECKVYVGIKLFISVSFN